MTLRSRDAVTSSTEKFMQILYSIHKNVVVSIEGGVAFDLKVNIVLFLVKLYFKLYFTSSQTHLFRLALDM